MRTRGIIYALIVCGFSANARAQVVQLVCKADSIQGEWLGQQFVPYEYNLLLDKRKHVVKINGKLISETSFDQDIIWFAIPAASGHIDVSAFNRSKGGIITKVKDAKSGDIVGSIHSTCR